MKHAGPTALDDLAPLLSELRALPGLVEKGRGIFYRKSRAYLHFHEDSAGLFADLRAPSGADFERFNVTHAEDRRQLVDLVRARLPD